MLALLPVLVLSSIGRRFSSVATHVDVEADGLLLGERRLASTQILDVWHDEARQGEGTNEARVIVAIDAARGAELAILYFENSAQAKRFAEAFTPRTSTFAGHRPRIIDALPSLRFVAIAGAFFGTGSWFGVLALGYFMLGALALGRAKQVIAKADGFEIHTLFGSRHEAYANVASVDADAGAVAMKDGSEIVIARAAIRDPMLGAPRWLDQARTRVLERIALGAASPD
jgi:hypothetical protein